MDFSPFAEPKLRQGDNIPSRSHNPGYERFALSSPKKVADGPDSRNVEYRELSLTGTAKLTEGKPLTISKLNGESLTLTISKAGKAE